DQIAQNNQNSKTIQLLKTIQLPRNDQTIQGFKNASDLLK
ncbi:21738_t:CDS:1, partial [Gigaspora margarita]